MTASQPIRFLLVGAGGYVANLALFALFRTTGMSYLVASICSYFASNALMYLGNRYVTFGLGHAGFLGAYVRYVLVGGVVAGGNALLLAGLVELAGLHPQLGLAIALLLVTPLAFILSRRWTFGVEPSARRAKRQGEPPLDLASDSTAALHRSLARRQEAELSQGGLAIRSEDIGDKSAREGGIAAFDRRDWVARDHIDRVRNLDDRHVVGHLRRDIA
jgi:putative flippase GtrA